MSKDHPNENLHPRLILNVNNNAPVHVEETRPNPDLNIDVINNKLYVLGIYDKANYSIYSLSGSLLQNGSIEDGSSVDLNLPQGIYIVRVQNNQTSNTKKIQVL